MAIITNLDQVRRGHEHFLAGNARLLVEAENMAGRHALTYVRQHSDFTRRSGKLQDKTKYRIVRTAGGRLLRISNPMPYAASIDTGSKAHWIYPKQTSSQGRTIRGSALKFVGRAGVMVFRRRVWHPGTRPYKFLYNATDSAYRVLGQELRRGMTEIAERF
jgi:hypothetical protein